MELWAGSGTHFVLTQITLQECTHTRFAGLPLCSQYHSVARMTSPSLGALQGTGTGTWAPNPVVLAGEEVGIRRRPRGPLPPSPHILCFPPAAKGRPGSLEKLFPCNPGRRQAREGRGGGGSAEGPVFAFISSNRRFYLWKRTDAGD